MPQDDLVKRVPPHSLEAEQACIGAMFMSSNAISTVCEVLRDGDFFDDRNRVLFSFIRELFEQRVPVDVVTVSERLRSGSMLDRVGGSVYLSKLIESVPASSKVGVYARIVLEKSMLRQLINASRTIIDSIYDNPSNIEKVFDDAERLVFEVTDRHMRTDYYQLKDIVNMTLKTIGDRHKSQHVYTGLETHYSDLDDLTGGLQNGDLVVLAARPGMGKTALALNITTRVAGLVQGRILEQKKPVLFFSLEMAFPELVLRLLSTESRINMQKIRKGQLSEPNNEWDQLIEAAGNLSHLNVIIDDKPMISLNEIRALSRRVKSKFDLSLIVIDHLQLITTTESYKAASVNRNVEISYISRSLKALAKELDLPIIALSQLSRGVESREGSVPRLSDLRESGAIEQDADIVAFLYREEYYKKQASDKQNVAELLVEKHRNGPQGRILLTFLKECVRFETLDEHSKHLLLTGEGQEPKRAPSDPGF